MSKHSKHSFFIYIHRESFHQVEGSPNTPQNSLKIKRGLIKSIDASNIRRQNVECKLEYLNKLPDPPKNNDNIPITPKNLEAMKFFGSTNPKKLRSAKSFSGKVSNFNSTVNHANVAEANKDLAWSIFKDSRRNVKDFEQGNEEKESLPLLKVKSGNSTPNPTTNVQEIKQQQGSDPQSPLISVQSWSIQRSQTAHSGKGQRYKTMTPKAPIQGEIIGKIYSSSGPTSPREPITLSHSSTPKSKGAESDKLYKLSQFNKERVHNETFYHFKEQEFACNTQEFEAELEKEPPVKFNFETTCADEPKIQKVSSVHTNDLFSKLSGHKSPHNARLHITKEWRQKVFKKTHQRHGSAGLNPTGLEFISSTLKSPSNKK